MTPEQCRELAKFHEHVAKWCREKAQESQGVVAASIMADAWEHDESARYWREKADG